MKIVNKLILMVFLLIPAALFAQPEEKSSNDVVVSQDINHDINANSDLNLVDDSADLFRGGHGGHGGHHGGHHGHGGRFGRGFGGWGGWWGGYGGYWPYYDYAYPYYSYPYYSYPYYRYPYIY